MKLKTRLLAVAALTAVLGLIAAPAAYAEPILPASTDPIQAEVDRLLAEFPGGIQTGTGEISWDEGRAVLTLAGAGEPRGIGSCSTGWFCAYSDYGLSGTKLAFSSCTATNSLAPIGNAPRSVANATNTAVRLYSSAGAMQTFAANSSGNTSVTATRLGC